MLKRRSCLLGLVATALGCIGLLTLILFPQSSEWDWTYHDVPSSWPAWDSPYPDDVTLEVSPLDALADTLLRVRVTGLRPGQHIALRLWTEDRDGLRWEFGGVWQADAQGVVDAPAKAPVEASAPLPDGDGLLSALRPVASVSHPFFRPAKPYTVHVQVEAEGRVLAEARAVRRHLATGVTCLELHEEQVGVYCRPEGEGPFPAVLVLGGSEGGVPRDVASWWASHGVAALGLAYFGEASLPRSLVEIPLEYFLAAVDALRDRPEVDPTRVLVWGASRGSEAALLTAAYHPDVAGVIAIAPSSVVWSGLDFSQGPRSAWTYGGKPLPFLSTALSMDMLRMMAGVPVSLRDEFERSLDGASPEAFIPVERVRGPVLLIAGSDDRLWPSDRFIDQIVARLNAQAFPYPVETVIVEGAGHTATLYEEPQPYIVERIVLGGTLEDNLRLSRRARQAMLDFMNQLIRRSPDERD